MQDFSTKTLKKLMPTDKKIFKLLSDCGNATGYQLSQIGLTEHRLKIFFHDNIVGKTGYREKRSDYYYHLAWGLTQYGRAFVFDHYGFVPATSPYAVKHNVRLTDIYINLLTSFPYAKVYNQFESKFLVDKIVKATLATDWRKHASWYGAGVLDDLSMPDITMLTENGYACHEVVTKNYSLKQISDKRKVAQILGAQFFIYEC